MKKHLAILAGGLALIITIAVATPVLAGSVPDRDVVALSATAGTATWTNTSDYAAIKLTRISVANSLNATNTVTVSRIITESGTSYTQTVGTVTCSGSAGTQATLAYSSLKNGDRLAFSSLVATGSTAIVEYDFHQH
jgi:hypothetical protein